MIDPIRYFRRFLLLALLMSGFSLAAAAEPCDPACNSESDRAGVSLDTEASTPETSTNAASTGQSSNQSQELCEQPEPWLFYRSYTAGSLTSHGGKIWEATQSTEGDMPGIAEPARWKLVPDHCAMTDQ